ncbi:MAG: CHAT domain-containing protein [Cytophagaceae bacterium]
MKNLLLHIMFLLLIAGPPAKAQEEFYYGKKISLNALILQLNARGDSAISSSNFLLAEKYFTKACDYTDTLVDYLKKKRGVKGVYTRTRIHLSFFSYEKLGSLYMNSGNLRKAEELFNKSLKQRERIFCKRSIFRVYPYVHLGQLYLQYEDTDEALRYFSKASYMVDRATTAGFNFDMLRYQLYGLHFEASLRKGRMKEAGKYLHRYYYSLNTVNPTSEQVAAALEMKARFLMMRGQLKEAAVYIHRAEKKLNSSHEIFSLAESKILRTKALYYWNRNLSDSASFVFETLLNSYERNIRKNFSSMSEYEREQFYVILKNDFDLFNSFVAAELGKGKTNSHLLEILYNTQLFTKALLLNELSKTRKNILAGSNETLIARIDEWQQAKNRIAYLHYNPNKSEAEIPLLEKKIISLEKEINQSSSFFTKSNEEVRWQQIRDLLGEGEAAVEVIRARTFSHAPLSDTGSAPGFVFSDTVNYIFLTVRPGDQVPSGFVLREGNRLETRYLSYYRNCIRQQISDTVSFGQFWEPLYQRLTGCSRLYFSGDGVYNQINLNVLLNPFSKRYVLDEINLVFLTNTRDLLSAKSKGKHTRALLYGRPSYWASDSSNKKAPEEISKLSSPALGTLMEFSRQKFADLPGTEKEIENISGIFNSNHWQTEIFIRENASEENLKSMRSADVIHIATHGFFLADDGRHVNSMIRSGIVLSGINRHSETSQEDGILTAYEATNLALDSSRLIVLSACETGLGEMRNGEGVYGLQRGLKVAGADNILMSLWKVNDEATAELMTSFYESWLGGMEIHSAFRQAQTRLRKKFPEPYYWGAFILLGN